MGSYCPDGVWRMSKSRFFGDAGQCCPLGQAHEVPPALVGVSFMTKLDLYMAIKYFDAPAGAGKTHALIIRAHKLASRGGKVLILQPTRRLIDRTIEAEINPLSPTYPVSAIHGDSCGSGVVSEITSHFKNAKSGGEIVLITHAAFGLVPYFHNANLWWLICDEAYQAVQFDEINLTETHKIITNHIALQSEGALYSRLMMKDDYKSAVTKIARNKRGDDLWSRIQPVAERIVSPHWDVYVKSDQYHSLIHDADKGKFSAFAILRPSIFGDFRHVVIASACFKDSLLYRIWVAQGYDIQPVKNVWHESLRYRQHENGGTITIQYASDEAWSKNYRDKIVDDASGCVLDVMSDSVKSHFGSSPFLWIGNKDIPDDWFGSTGQRLPNTPHGLNDYQGIHNVVALSALNPAPSHFGFLATYGVSGDEVRTAIYRSAVYQAVMRCSIRNPDDLTPKNIVVMDKDTADWLANIFPGASVQPLDGIACDIMPRKGKPGRKRLYSSPAESKAASRRKRLMDLFQGLDSLNASIAPGEYPQPLKNHPDEAESECVEKSNLLSTAGTIYESIYSKDITCRVDYESDDEFIELLKDMHEDTIDAKEDGGLISPAYFDPDLSTETRRGLANVRYIRGIWFDNDGGDLSHSDFSQFFPHLRIAVWNTYSHTPQKPRWRAFIPTTLAMTIDVHQVIMAQFERALNMHGYWSQQQIDKNPKIKNKFLHGFDRSKFTGSSLFYLPSQAREPEHSFFRDYAEIPRGALDVREWLKNSIIDLGGADDGVVDAAEPPRPASAVSSTASDALRALRNALHKDDEASEYRVRAVERAINKWRETPPGEGHTGFFRLAASLKRVGLDDADLIATLKQEAAFAAHPAERRKEIQSLVRSVRRFGRI